MLDEAILKIMATREKSKVKPLKKIFMGQKGTHCMGGGQLMSGAKHTKDSKPIKGKCKTRKGRGKRTGY